MRLPYLSKFGFQKLLWSCKESCYLLVLETGKLRHVSGCHPELNMIASLLFLEQNQFYCIYFLDIWSHFMKSNASSQEPPRIGDYQEKNWNGKKGVYRTTMQDREVMTLGKFLKDCGRSYLGSKHSHQWQSNNGNPEKGAEPGHHHVFLPS